MQVLFKRTTNIRYINVLYNKLSKHIHLYTLHLVTSSTNATLCNSLLVTFGGTFGKTDRIFRCTKTISSVLWKDTVKIGSWQLHSRLNDFEQTVQFSVPVAGQSTSHRRHGNASSIISFPLSDCWKNGYPAHGRL